MPNILAKQIINLPHALVIIIIMIKYCLYNVGIQTLLLQMKLHLSLKSCSMNLPITVTINIIKDKSESTNNFKPTPKCAITSCRAHHAIVVANLNGSKR